MTFVLRYRLPLVLLALYSALNAGGAYLHHAPFFGCSDHHHPHRAAGEFSATAWHAGEAHDHAGHTAHGHGHSAVTRSSHGLPDESSVPAERQIGTSDRCPLCQYFAHGQTLVQLPVCTGWQAAGYLAGWFYEGQRPAPSIEAISARGPPRTFSPAC